MMSRKEKSSVFKEQDYDNAMDRIDFSKVARGVKQRLWAVILCCTLFTLGAGLLSWHLSKKFHAEVLLLYREESQGIPLPGLGNGYDLGRFSMATVLETVSLPSHFKAVKSILGLSDDPEDLEKQVSVERPNRHADIIRVEAQADNPALAVDIVNTLASVAVKHSQAVRANRLQVARDYLRAKSESVQSKLNEQLQAIATFRREHDLVELDDGSIGGLRGWEKAEETLQDAKVRYESMLVEYENLRREVAKIPDEVVKVAYEDDPIKQRVGHTEMALLQARSRYAPDNPKVKVLEEELRQLRTMALESKDNAESRSKVFQKNEIKEQLNLELVRMQGKLRAAEKVKEEAELVVMQFQQEMMDLPEEQMLFVRLVQRKAAITEELQGLEEALRTAEVMMSLGKSNVEVYQKAESAVPYKSNFITFLPLVGAACGLAFGFILFAALELMDRKYRTKKELKGSYTAPCLQVIPELPRLSAKNVEKQMRFFQRNISDRLASLKGEEAPRSVLFTSGRSGDGKTTLALQFAKYQKQLGKRVLLLEFDPSANPYWSEGGAKASLGSYLRSQASLDEVIECGDVDRAKADTDEGLKELILSSKMEELWHECQLRYDLIVVDAPAVIEEDYVVNLAHHAELNVFVIGSSQIKCQDVDAALELLDSNQIDVDGLVLNRVRSYYLDDPRVKANTKKLKKEQWRQFFSWGSKKGSQNETAAS